MWLIKVENQQVEFYPSVRTSENETEHPLRISGFLGRFIRTEGAMVILVQGHPASLNVLISALMMIRIV